MIRKKNLLDERIRREDRTRLDHRTYLQLNPVNLGVDPRGMDPQVGEGVAMTVDGQRQLLRPRPGWLQPVEVMRRTTSANWAILG